MLEDSISCSPGNDKKGSRSRRFHKKTKRKSGRLADAPTDNTFADDLPCLDALYEDSGQSVEPLTTQYEHFNPFENEIVLAAADMSRASTSTSKLNNCISQGFMRLEKLSVIANEEDSNPTKTEPSANVLNSTVPTILGPETQFGISDSEFVRFCDEAEIDVKSQSTVETKTPKGTKSIVDVILEDFCGSPCSESPPRFTNADTTPIFLFRSKSLRTYSGCWRKKRQRNFVTELANIHLPENDDNSSDSSGLSVQEDLSQSVVPQLDTVDLNNSIRVCENLLNLSSYFSQVSSLEKSLTMSGEMKKIPLSAVLEQIVEIRRKSQAITRSKSMDEFYGFSDSDSDSKEDTLKELLEDEDDVLQQIDCDSLCYESVKPKSSFTYNCCTIEAVLKDANAVIEESNKLISSNDYLHRKEDFTNNNQSNCDKPEDVARNSSINSPQEDEQLFDELDLWNDDEVLLNYVTQKNHNFCKPDDGKQSSIDGTCLNLVSVNTELPLEERLKDSKCAMEKWKEVAGTFDNKFEDERLTTFNGFSTRNSPGAAFQKPTDTSPVPGFLGFSTASSKPIAISNEAKRKASAFLKTFEQEERENIIVKADEMDSGVVERKSQKSDDVPISAKIIDPIAAQKDLETSPDPTFLGFSTASKKPIAISEQAKQRADGILIKFEEEEHEKRVKDKDMPLEGVKTKNKVSDDTQAPVKDSFDNKYVGFEGFSTASRKPITISDGAKRKADEILKKFEETEKDEKLQPVKELTTANGQLRKSEEASEQVKQKAQELLRDVEFFEEVFEEELTTLKKEPTADIQIPCIQRIIPKDNQPIFEGFKTASKKSIKISKIAKRHANQLLRKVENEGLPLDFLKCIEADLDNASSSMERIEQVDGASKNPGGHLQKMSKTGQEYLHVNGLSSDSNGFNSVSKKSVKFVLDDFGKVDPAFARVDEINDDTHPQYNITKKHVNLKRKCTELYTQNVREAPDLISPRRLSYSERSPLNCIENAVLHKTSSMPLIKSTPKSTLISRKNLLSLNKRKKFNSPGSVGDTITTPRTPEKEQHPTTLHSNTNATPNLKEFFDSVSTSTPRLIRNVQSKVDVQIRKDSSIDTDFQEINWDDANNSARLCRTSFVADSNVVCSQQRIERLKMYGEPPPISPILMVNKCRPSGLRRGRSLMKP